MSPPEATATKRPFALIPRVIATPEREGGLRGPMAVMRGDGLGIRLWHPQAT